MAETPKEAARGRGPLGGAWLPSPLGQRATMLYLLGALVLFAVQHQGRLGLPASALLSEPARVAVALFEGLSEFSEGTQAEAAVLMAREASAEALARVRDELTALSAASQDEQRARKLAGDAHELGVRVLVLESELAAAREDRAHRDLLVAYAREQRGDPLLDAALRVYLPGGPDEAPDPAPPTPAQWEAVDALAPSTSSDLLRAGLLRADGREEEATTLDRARVERAEASVARMKGALALAVALVVLGAAAAVAFGVLGPRHQVLGQATMPPGQSATLGLDLFARGLFGFQLLSFTAAEVGQLTGLRPPPGILGLVAWSPLLVWTVRTLTLRGTLEQLGLSLRPAQFARLVPFSLAVFALQSAVFVVLLALLGRITFGSDWANPVTERWLLGADSTRLGIGLEAVLWAPLFEEIAFRGLLFGALRSRMGFTGAALSSSLLFAAVHPYGPQGLVGLTWLGFVFCFAYERSRSLWPAIAAHGLHNGANLFFLEVLRGGGPTPVP